MHPGYKSSVPTGVDAIEAHFEKGDFKTGVQVLQNFILGRLSGSTNRVLANLQAQINDLQEQTNLIGTEATGAKRLAELVEERVETLETPQEEPTMVPQRFQLGQVTFLGITLPDGDIIDVNELPQVMGAQDVADYIGCSRHKVYRLIKDGKLDAQKATSTRQYVVFRRSLVRYFESDFELAGRVVRVRGGTEDPAYTPPAPRTRKVARVKRKT